MAHEYLLFLAARSKNLELPPQISSSDGVAALSVRSGVDVCSSCEESSFSVSFREHVAEAGDFSWAELALFASVELDVSVGSELDS